MTILAFVHVQSPGQERNEPFVVNPLIGDTLDATERDHFGLLQHLAGFQHAVFYLNADSSLRVRASMLHEGQLKDTVIQRYRTLASMEQHIEQVAKEKPFFQPAPSGTFQRVTLTDGSELLGSIIESTNSKIVFRTTGGVTR